LCQPARPAPGCLGSNPQARRPVRDRGSSCCKCRSPCANAGSGPDLSSSDHRMPADPECPLSGVRGFSAVPTQRRCGDFIPGAQADLGRHDGAKLHSATNCQPTKIGFLRRSGFAVARPECRRGNLPWVPRLSRNGSAVALEFSDIIRRLGRPLSADWVARPDDRKGVGGRHGQESHAARRLHALSGRATPNSPAMAPTLSFSGRRSTREAAAP
jgi:hypothetical protein